MRAQISSSIQADPTDSGDRTAEPERLAFSVNELIKAVGIARRTLYAEVNSGRLKVTKLGKRSLFRRENVVAWLDGLDRESKGDGGAKSWSKWKPGGVRA
jgi:excisionase family DNA binding protein